MAKSKEIDLNAGWFGGQSRIEWLRARMRDKEVGSLALYSSIANPPARLNHNTIKGWLCSHVKTATWEHWIAVECAVRAYEKKIDLTETLQGGQSRIEWLRARMQDKGIGARALFSSIENPPAGLSRNTINNWLYALAQTATWEHWIAVKNAIRKYDFRAQLAEENRIDLTETLQGGQSRIEWLRARMQDKGVREHALFGSIENPPAELRYYTIESWLNGSTKTATWEHWVAVKNAIRKYDFQAQLAEENLIDLTKTLPGGQSRIEWLRAQMQDKGVGARALFGSIENPAAGLSRNTIDKWLAGHTKTTTWEHWVAVKNAVRKYDFQAQLAKENLLDLTETLQGGQSRIEWLRARMRDKEVGSLALYSSIANPPARLNHNTIKGWLCSHVKTATWEHWIAVERAVRAYEKKIDLTETLQGGQSRIEWLRARMQDKEVGACALFSSIANPPAGLKYYTIQNWLTGKAHTATWEHWITVKRAVRKYEFKEQFSKATRLGLTETLQGGQNRIEWLRARMQDKGVGACALFGSIENPPAELNYHIIKNWLNGNAKTATWEHWVAVKNAVRKYDFQAQLAKENRLDLTETLQGGQSRIEWLRARMQDKGVGAFALFNSIANPLAGLNPHLIQSWIRDHTKTASWVHWEAVVTAIKTYRPAKKTTHTPPSGVAAEEPAPS